MRIVMMLTPGTPFGGDWARAAASAVDVVTVDLVHRLTLPLAEPGIAARGTAYQVARISPRPTRLLHPLTDRVIARRLDRCLSLIERNQGPIDLLHTHIYSTTGPLKHLRAGIPYVHTEHASSLTPLAAEHKRLSNAGRSMARRAFADSAMSLAVSEYLRDSILSWGFAGPIRVVPNPVAVDLFSMAGSIDACRLVWVGRIEADKRPDVLISGFAKARTRLPKLHLDVIGDGPDRGKIEALAEGLGVSDCVTFFGVLPRDQVAARVRTASAFVSTSRVETFGMAVAEALAAGVPVVAPDAAALPELVNEANGILFDPGSPEALADGLVSVIGQAFDRYAIAATIRARYSPVVIGATLKRIYSEIAFRASAGDTSSEES